MLIKAGRSFNPSAAVSLLWAGDETRGFQRGEGEKRGTYQLIQALLLQYLVMGLTYITKRIKYVSLVPAGKHSVQNVAEP